jgi:hypothetical protein
MARTAEAPGNRVVRARRLIRAEPDALLATLDLHVERPVRTHAHTTVPAARAAAGRHHGGAVCEVRWIEGRATRGMVQRRRSGARGELERRRLGARALFNSARCKRRASFGASDGA